MYVIIKRTYECGFGDEEPIEDFSLEVSGYDSDVPNTVADIYLALRKKLNEGIKGGNNANT